MNKFTTGRLALVIVAALATSAAAQTHRLDQHVNDEAGVIDGSTRQRLEQVLTELEQKTTAQIVVLTIRTTGGRDIYEYGRDVFNSAGRTGRGLGQKGKDNGLLILIAVNDRKCRFLVGQGIEHVLPDTLCHQIIEDYFVPNFKRGDYSGGIYNGTVAAAQRLATESGAALTSGQAAAPPPRKSSRRSNSGAPCVSFFVFVLIIFALNAASRRRRFGYQTWGGGGFWQGVMWSTLFNALGNASRGSRGGSSWGGGGWSSGGWGGGGGGGFGGGGGGSFGGGGSGGSW